MGLDRGTTVGNKRTIAAFRSHEPTRESEGQDVLSKQEPAINGADTTLRVASGHTPVPLHARNSQAIAFITRLVCLIRECCGKGALGLCFLRLLTFESRVQGT